MISISTTRQALRNKGNKLRLPKRMFTQEEDNKIKHLVQINGEKAWKVIASEFPDRSPRQCRERWKNYLSPTVRNLPWTPEEDAKLAELFSQFGPQWAKIASLFNARTDVNVKNRWSYLKRKEKRIKSTKQYQTNEAQNFNQNKNSAIPISNNDVIGNYTQEVIGPPNNQTKALGNSQNNSQINQQMNQKSDQQQKDKDNNEIESSLTNKSSDQLIDFWDSNWEITDENNTPCF